MKALVILFIFIFNQLYCFPDGSPECYKEICRGMATTQPSESLQVSINGGNEYTSCGANTITLTFPNSVKGVLVSVQSESDVVGNFETASGFQKVVMDVAGNIDCITHMDPTLKNSPLSFTWNAPDTDEDLTIYAFVVVERPGGAATTVWGRATLAISHGSSQCPSTSTISSTTEPSTSSIPSTTEPSTSSIPSTSSETLPSVSETQTSTEIFCTEDAKVCPDGSSVGRDPNNNCEFFPCPEPSTTEPSTSSMPSTSSETLPSVSETQTSTEIFCTLDARLCPDGSSVGRDPNNNCEFFPCPEPSTTEPSVSESQTSTEIFCTEEVMMCPDGSFVARDPNNNCEFFPCPEPSTTQPSTSSETLPSVSETQTSTEIFCTEDAKVCPDGSSVGRDPNNNCEFFPCPEPSTTEPSVSESQTSTEIFCTLDAKLCPDGSFVGRDPNNNCEFFPCPEPSTTEPSVSETQTSTELIFCTEDAKLCPDGSSVGRDPNNNCEFFPCPEPSTTQPSSTSMSSTVICPDGECPTGHTTPEPLEDLCESDVKDCGNGIYMSRDPDNNCEHFECLNSSDCIHGTKRFGGYCACWSGAYGKDCKMGSAKVGTAPESIVQNAFSKKVRAIEDMYYKIDFDLMLGKAFLRNFTGHPSCPEGNQEKVRDLETAGVPKLDSASMENGALVLKVSQNMVDGRADGAVFLNDDNVDSGMHVDCYYPRSDYIEKLVEGCRDAWKFEVPWKTAKTCGWKISSEETHIVYRGQVIIHNMEWVSIKQWRIIRSVLRIKIRFQRFIRVECETKTFNAKIIEAAITRQIVAIQLGQPALVELTTVLNYPYKLFEGKLTKYPTENITSFEFTSIDCNAGEGEECVQNWRTNLHMAEHACHLDGDYSMSFILGCTESLPENECPIERNETVIDYKLKSEDFCAEIQVDVGIYGYILCFLDQNFKEHKEIFIIGQRAYFLIKINSDINPRNESGNLDADYYDDSTAVIKFSSVTIVTITIRFELTGEVIRLWENGKPCPDVFGIKITLEKKYGDGTPLKSNAIGFSFEMTRELLRLKQNTNLKITIGAEVEAHYSDSTSKRMYLANEFDQSDRSTFSTSPQVQDDRRGIDESNTVAVIASIMSIVLALLL